MKQAFGMRVFQQCDEGDRASNALPPAWIISSSSHLLAPRLIPSDSTFTLRLHFRPSLIPSLPLTGSRRRPGLIRLPTPHRRKRHRKRCRRKSFLPKTRPSSRRRGGCRCPRRRSPYRMTGYGLLRQSEKVRLNHIFRFLDRTKTTHKPSMGGGRHVEASVECRRPIWRSHLQMQSELEGEGVFCCCPTCQMDRC